MHTVRAKQPRCVVSVLSNTSSVCVGLFLALADNFQPVYHTFVHHQTNQSVDNPHPQSVRNKDLVQLVALQHFT